MTPTKNFSFSLGYGALYFLGSFHALEYTIIHSPKAGLDAIQIGRTTNNRTKKNIVLECKASYNCD